MYEQGYMIHIYMDKDLIGSIFVTQEADVEEEIKKILGSYADEPYDRYHICATAMPAYRFKR